MLHGARADVLVVSAALPDGGTGLFLVDRHASALTRDGYRTHDGGRAAKVTFDGTPATPLGAATTATGVIARVLDSARIAACNEAVGLMEVALRDDLDVPQEPQAVRRHAQHVPGADVPRRPTCTSRWSWPAAWRCGRRWCSPTAPARRPSVAASRAALQVSRAGRHIGQEAIQLHGGIGMTAEYSIGTYTSRLTALDHLLGDGNHHLGLLAAGVAGTTRSSRSPSGGPQLRQVRSRPVP